MGPLRLVVSPGAWFKLPNRSLESCATNSTITNGLPSSRFCRTNRAVPACERPSCSEWHLLGSTIWGTVARPAGQPWSVYHLLQSLRSLATSRRLGQDHGRTGRRSRRRRADDRHVCCPRGSARCLHHSE